MIQLKTSYWETLHVFDRPVEGKSVQLIDSSLEVPQGMDPVIRENWDKQLESKRTDIPCSEIKPYHLDRSENPLNALYLGETPRMWPGPAVSLKEVRVREGIELHVGQTFFPFINGLKDPKVRALYEQQGIPLPRPSLAICTYALTLDDKLTLTLRGPATNMYPGRLYGQGGNPLFTNTSVIEHQIEEMQDEILVTPKEYSPNDFHFTGLVVDRESLPDKPDLVGWVPIQVESEKVRERIYQRGTPFKGRPNDAVGVVFVPAKEESLADYLVNVTHPLQFTPPGHAGLVLYGLANFGESWSKYILSKLE